MPSVMPPAFNPPSVIPDIFNRESKSSSMQAHTNKRTTKQDAGFPLTLSPTFVIGETGGNDRGDPAGMTEAHPAPSPLAGEGRGEGLSGHDRGETGRQDKEARRAGTKGVAFW